VFKSARSTTVRGISVLCLAGVVATLAACANPSGGGGGTNTSPPGGKSIPTVRLGVGSSISDAVYRVDARQIAKDSGIDLRIGSFDRGFQGVQAAAASSLDGGISVEYPLLTLVASGVKNVVALAACTTAPDIKMVVTSNIKGPKDLVGKRIGITTGSSFDYAFRHYLKINGLSAGDVKFVNLPGTAQIASLAKGEIDGLVNVEPQLSQALTTVRGSKLLDPDINSAYVSRVWLSVNKPWAEANHEAVIKLLQSLNKTAEYIKNSPDEAYGVIAKELNIDQKLVADTVKSVPYTWGCYIDDESIQAMQGVADFVKENGQGTVDIAKVIDSTYLQEAAPDAVHLSKDSLKLLGR